MRWWGNKYVQQCLQQAPNDPKSEDCGRNPNYVLVSQASLYRALSATSIKLCLTSLEQLCGIYSFIMVDHLKHLKHIYSITKIKL